MNPVNRGYAYNPRTGDAGPLWVTSRRGDHLLPECGWTYLSAGLHNLQIIVKLATAGWREKGSLYVLDDQLSRRVSPYKNANLKGEDTSVETNAACRESGACAR